MIKWTEKRFTAMVVVLMMMVSLFMPLGAYAEETKASSNVEKTTTVEKKEVVEAETKTIDIVSINDFHGNVTEDARESGKNMGMSKVINAVKSNKAKNPNTIAVSAGDSYQGTAMSNLTYGAPVSEMYKEMGIVASAVGNHEFDWGIQRVEKWAKDGNFDFLAANIIDKTTGKAVTWAKPYKVVEQDGIKIGFIGLTTRETAYTTLPENVKNYEFSDLKETAKEWTDFLKSGNAPEGKVDVVIALTHVASFQDRETKEVKGDVVDSGLCSVENLDAVISGHSHQAVAGYVNDKAVVQGYKYGRALGKLTISLDKDNKVSKITPAVDMLYKRKSELIADKDGQAIHSKYENELKPVLDEVVGSAKEGLSHERHSKNGTTVLGQWVSDVIRKKADAQIGLMNEGGLRTNIPAGDITVGKLYEVMPFDNTLVKMEIKGEQLKKVIDNGISNPNIGWVEVAGLKVNYDMSKPFGSRVIDMYLEDGTKVEMDKYYSVSTNDFMASGGDKYDFEGAKNFVNTMEPIRDVITDYIKEVKEVNVKFEQPLVAKVEEVATEEKVVTAEKAVIEEKVATDKKVITNVYVVKSGDTLSKISAKFGMKYQEVAAYNKIKNPHLIFINQKILIPVK